jgi:hypothetical protein
MRAMLKLFRLPTGLSLLGLSVTSLDAQPASATFRPALIQSYSAGYSWSGESDLERGAALGGVSVHHVEGSFSGRAPVNEATTFTYGAAFSINEFEADAGLPLPDRLGELTFNLGITRRFSPQWSGSAFLRPGIYSDLEDFSSDAVNAPGLMMANFAQSADLVWTFGAAVNPFSDRILMPVAGVRWKFAPRWMFNLGFPRAGFTWEANERLSLRAGLGIQGGSYRVTENLGSPAAGVRRLANTYVQYREIRFGAGADWALSKTVSLVVEAGVMTDRRFEYYDRDYTLNGSAAPYLTLGVNGRF